MSFRGAVPHFSLGDKRRVRRLLCIRPKDPALAVATAQALAEKLHRGTITAKEFDRQFQDMIGLQEYRWAGMLKQPVEKNAANEARLVDIAGNDLGWSQLGDSFVEDTIENAAQAAKP